MDDELAAPSRNEKLTIRPSANYIQQDLLPLYKGVGELRANEQVTFNDHQQIVWAIRNVAVKETPYIRNLNSRQKAILNRAVPGGTALLERAHLAETNAAPRGLSSGFSDGGW